MILIVFVLKNYEEFVAQPYCSFLGETELQKNYPSAQQRYSHHYNKSWLLFLKELAQNTSAPDT
tara:strand:+ start:311 stop:502 length:192 start_codon:yes stop_codon:yes gene_type:complete